ncbi:formylglycine-generating enzyme family protein [Oceaniglobus trochenteri]|uniref:formylglycine-generating enzyme family protein n=1 Tax=Oceaniglobus trochenteri TaxID=2763260 RepID=UPI001D0005FF|nr:formylglycine-generating enzyme family protein [Oceaniglobus trochenteri]
MKTSPKPACCTPTAGARAPDAPATFDANARMDPSLRDCVPVPGGTSLIGTDRPVILPDEESPLRRARVKPLWWERGTTTNAAFARFVAATGYQSEAERFGWSFVFWMHVPEALNTTRAVDGLEWWRRVDGACWAHPTGPEGPPADPDHPVVHMSWADARAYAGWAGGRLPREAEWEHAARGGLGDVRYPWGDREPDDTEFMPCNIWQGDFPRTNTCADGHSATAPAISFAPNGYGLFNMVGNVWEWSGDPFRLRSLKKTARNAAPHGPQKMLKGGSFLCHASYCHRYRIAARTGNTPDSATTHMGFRVVYDSPPPG